MDWSQTWLGIANNALSRINKSPLQTLDDSSTSALLCRQLIPESVKNILNQYPWHSARKRTVLAPLTETPEYGYRNVFEMPDDYIRLVSVDSLYRWSREGNRILSDDGTLCIIYVAVPASPYTLDPLIVDTITAQLASQLAVSLTSDSSLVNLLYQETEIKLQKAKLQEDAGEEDIKPHMHSWANEIRRDGNSGCEGFDILRQLYGERG